MLTPSAVADAKLQEKPYKLYDERVMFVLVTSSGGKLWCWRYCCPIAQKESLLGR